MFFTYNLFSEPREFENIDPDKLSDKRIPDRRNTLYWQSDLKLSEDRETKIQFFSSDVAGDYIVYITSNDPDGKSGIYGTCYFTVE